MYVVVYKHVRNSVVCVVVMGLVLRNSLMVIYTTGILVYAKVSPLYNVLWDSHGRYTPIIHYKGDILLHIAGYSC